MAPWRSHYALPGCRGFTGPVPPPLLMRRYSSCPIRLRRMVAQAHHNVKPGIRREDLSRHGFTSRAQSGLPGASPPCPARATVPHKASLGHFVLCPTPTLWTSTGGHPQSAPSRRGSLGRSHLEDAFSGFETSFPAEVSPEAARSARSALPRVRASVIDNKLAPLVRTGFVLDERLLLH